MAYHTGIYLLLFLPAVLLLYQLTPKKSRWITLLAAGYLFFWICSGKLVLYLLGTTLFTHYIAVWISWIKTKCNDETAGMQRTEAGTIKKAYKKKEKAILVFGICVLLGILAYLKYYNFFIQNVNVLLAQGGSSLALGTKQMLIPVGISFYTLQAIGYMADVYWEKVEVFRHPGKIALFLGFFPQIMEGPISSYAQTADTLFEGNPLTMENLAQGSVRIFWGLFKKLLIADRLYLLVDVIFNNYQYHYGEMIVIVAIAYTTQLYMEFSPLSSSITLPSGEYSIAFLTMFVSASVVQRLSQCMMQSCFSSMVRLWISKRIATDGFTASKSSDVWTSFLIKSIAWASSFAILRSAPTSHSILFNETCML